jgi:predicted TIM-barrel fold metal-dependent hydrolase
MADLVGRLPGTVVIDHMGRVPLPEGTAHAAFDLVRRWMDTGRFWVKLSGPYLETKGGAPRYGDCAPIAQGFLQHAPQRCVWGSDWPHPTEPTVKPDDAQVLDLLAEWAGSSALRHQVLVENPAMLYGFGG